jgi:membrane protein involved in colicin uptake
MKKLEPIMQAFQKILGGIFAAFEPVLDIFIEMVEMVLPYFTQYIGIVYSSLFGLFTFVKDVGVGVGKVLAGIFTQDFSMIEEGVEQVKNSISNSVDAGMEAYERFEAGSKELTASEKEQEEERRKAAEEAAKAAEEARQKAFEERLKRMDAEDKLDEAMLNKQRAEVLALAQTEQEKLDIEKKFAELSHQARLKDLADRMALYGKDSLEYKALQTEKINAETEYITQQKAFLDQQAKMNEDARLAQEEKDKKAIEDERALRLFDLQQQLEELDKENQMFIDDFESDKLRFAEQQRLLDEREKVELENTLLTEVQKKEIAKRYADERKKITDAEVANEKAAQEAKLAIQMAYANAVGSFGKLLQEAAGRNKGLAIAGIVIEQAAAIASIAVNASKNFVKDGGITSPLAIANLAAAGVQAASAILAAKKGIAAITKTAIPGGGGGGGGAGASVGTAPSFSAPSGMAAPQINAGVQQSPSSQIAQSIATAQNRPIVAQVVSTAVSSQQALDRRTNGASTFGGG